MHPNVARYERWERRNLALERFSWIASNTEKQAQLLLSHLTNREKQDLAMARR